MSAPQVDHDPFAWFARTFRAVHENVELVIHGKGDGILQRGVHDYLKSQSVVADYYFSRPEDGGYGKTMVTLKR